MIWNLFDIMISLLETLMYYYFMSRSLQWKENHIIKKIGYILIFPFSMLFMDYLGVMDSYKTILLILICCATTLCLFEATLKQNIMLNIILIFLSIVSDTISIGIMMGVNALHDINILMENNYIHVQFVLFAKAIYFVSLIIWVKFSVKSKESYSIQEIVVFVVQAFTSIFTMFVIVEFSIYTISTYQINSIILTVLAVCINLSFFITYLMFDHYFHLKQEEIKFSNIRGLIDKQYTYYSVLEENQTMVRKMYHDLKHHLIAIRGLLGNNSQEAEEYIDGIYERISVVEQFYHTGNALLDIILNEKRKEAKDKRMDMEVTIEKNSLNQLEMVDLCTIFSNAIDNALESCEKEQIHGKLKIKSRCNEAESFIVFANPIRDMPKMKNGKLITSKPDSKQHGLGLESVNSAVQKYGGSMRIEFGKGQFLLIIMIPNPDIPVVT